MTLKQYYKGKRMLVTGTTGFLGKVLLEKVLYSLPEVELVYVLIRGKKGSHLSERFKKEIVSSPCFDRLRRIHENRFDDFIESKVLPIQGDLHQERVGLSPKDYQEITTRVHVIINCAASIDFNARIDHAIQSNILGSLRMMALAKDTQNLEVFTHVSTCYVNCNLRGLIREDIYEEDDDPERKLETLLALPSRELIARTSTLLGGYPNTYTYTKALCERLMKARRGNLTLNIVRPAIINTSYAEPFPGWLDSIAAAAALYMFSGLGIIKELEGNAEYVGDTVPVDIVVGNIIVSTAFNACSNNLSIYHVGSSDRNPISWRQVETIVKDFWTNNPSQSQVSKPSIFISSSQYRIKMNEFFRKIPSWLYSKSAPFLGKQHVKNSQKLLKTEERGNEIKKIFHFFIQSQWIYECRKVREMTMEMNTKEREEFLVDCADIDMKYFIVLNNYGIQKYILKENIEMPTPENLNLLKMRPQSPYFSDIKWALTEGGVSMKGRNGKQFRVKILASGRVLSAIENETLKRQENSTKTYEEQKKIVIKQANNIASEIVGEFKMPVVRFMAWALHKIFKRVYEKVNVNSEMFQILKQIEEKRKIPIVLLPTHRSYIDFLIVSYIFFLYKLKLPYIVSDEALMHTYLIPFLIRSSGAFFFKKFSYQKSELYRSIFDEYVQRLLVKGNNLEFFVEGTRSRTGKTLTPKLEILEVLIEAVDNKVVDDICMVPLTINYEKVLEGDTFPAQLLGEEKVEQSLLRVIKASPLIRENFGRVYVQISEPFFLENFMKENKHLIKPVQKGKGIDPAILNPTYYEITKALGFKIVHNLAEKVVIMSTGLVSAVLLMHRKGITEDLLIKTVHWLAKYIVKKGYKIGGINQNSATFAVRNAINYLDNITVKTKKSIFELQISAGNDFQKILMLSYYRNTITNAFLPEAFLGCSLASFGEQLYLKEGVKIYRAEEETRFLMQILQLQFICSVNLSHFCNFSQLIKELMRNSIINKIGEEKVTVNQAQEKYLIFYCSLLRPTIQCYWSALVYLLTIARSETKQQEVNSQSQFYDQVQWFMESLYEEKVIENYESCSLETIKNAFEKYKAMNLLSWTQVHKRQVRIDIECPVEKIEELQSNLKKFLKNVHSSSVTSPMDIAKSTVVGRSLGRL